MADLTQFVSSLPSFNDQHVVTALVTEDEYAAIAYNNTGTPDMANPLYDVDLVDPAFATTLYYVREN